MSGQPGNPALFWRVVVVLAFAAIVGVIVHLHGRLADIAERLDAAMGDLGARDPGASGFAAGDGSGSRGVERGRSAGANIGALTARVERLEAAMRLLASSDPRRAAGGEAGSSARPERGGREVSPAFLQARERDAARYDARSLQEMESLYRKGNEQIGTEEGKRALEELVEKYPDSNRGGCAAMNLGATYLNEGDLDSAAEHFEALMEAGSEAAFDNGEKVLPKAMYNYGMVLEKRKDAKGAKDVFEDLAARFPDEKDGAGVSYADLVAGRLEGDGD